MREQTSEELLDRDRESQSSAVESGYESLSKDNAIRPTVQGTVWELKQMWSGDDTQGTTTPNRLLSDESLDAPEVAGSY